MDSNGTPINSGWPIKIDWDFVVCLVSFLPTIDRLPSPSSSFDVFATIHLLAQVTINFISSENPKFNIYFLPIHFPARRDFSALVAWSLDPNQMNRLRISGHNKISR